jgi:Ubiquitin-like autophagy protein Apg12
VEIHLRKASLIKKTSDITAIFISPTSFEHFESIPSPCELFLTKYAVTIHFQPLLNAPALKQTRFKITSTQPFGAVVSFLRKKLKVREGESLWCYIDNFAPAPDEGVGGLYNVRIPLSNLMAES